MKNLTHAMKDMNITDSLKASTFYLDEISQVVAFCGLGEDSHSSLATKSYVLVAKQLNAGQRKTTKSGLSK